MKKKIICVMLSMCLSFCYTVTVCATNESLSTSDSRTPITSGALYNDIINICPDVTVYDSNNTLDIYINKINMENGGKSAAFDFITYVAGILSCKNLNQYKNAVIGHFDDDGLVTISISNYKDANHFMSSLSTNFDDETFNAAVQDFYNDILGHFDSEYYFQTLEYALKESAGEKAAAPDMIYADQYLLYGSILTNLHWYEVKNNTMYIHLDKLSVSKEGGALFGQYVSKFINTFASAPKLYSFDTFEFVCIGDNERLLCTIAFYVDDSNTLSVANENFYCSDFFQGFTDSLNI